MNYRSILIIFLAMLGLAIDGWGQDWDKIAFISDREGILNVWIMNADGSDPVNLTKGRYCTSPAWSPDGMRIAFVSSPSMGDQFEIWVVDIDGSNLVELTNGLGGNWPTWRPAPPAATSVEAQSWGQIKSLLSEGTR